MRNDAVRFNDSIEDLCQLYEERRKNDVRLSAYDISLAELSGDPAEVYRSLIKAELNLFPGRDYQNGSAKRDDELLLNSGTNGVILTAEHASNHRRRRKRMLYIRHTKVAEWGTGALVTLVGEGTNSDSVVAIGRQTGDANNDKKHPFKEALGFLIHKPDTIAHISLHGMVRAHALDPKAKRGRSVELGIGDNPSDATRTLTHDYLKIIGKDLDLIIGINDPHLRFKRGRPVLNLTHRKIKTATFKGSGNTTRAYSESQARLLDKGDSFAAVQIEISNALRIPGPRLEDDPFPTQRDRWLGAHLGYLFVRQAVESVIKL